MQTFSYRTTRAFLNNYLSQLPMKGHGETSRIARFLMISPTLMSQITSGNKNFTCEQALKFCKYLKLTALEADYFMAVVQKERSGTSDLKEYWTKKIEDLEKSSRMLSMRVESTRQMSADEQSRFYSTFLYAAMSLFSSLGKNGKSLEEISERFRLSRDEARGYLEFLVATNNCEERGGRFYHTSQKNHLSSKSSNILRHHTNWRLLALRRGERLSDEELMYSVPISISRKDFTLLREEMVQFVRSFLEKVHGSEAEELACLNLDFFWLMD